MPISCCSEEPRRFWATSLFARAVATREIVVSFMSIGGAPVQLAGRERPR